MYIREYMTTPVITIPPDALLSEALEVIRQHNIRRLPVVDSGGKLVGLLTRQTMRQAMASAYASFGSWGERHQVANMKVRDVMIAEVVTTRPEATLAEAMAVAEENQIGNLPVVDSQGKLVGMVTNTDLRHLMGQLLGFGQPGPRLYVYGLGGPGDSRRFQVVELLGSHRMAVHAILNMTLPASGEGVYVIRPVPATVGALVADIEKLGLRVEVREQ